MSRSFPGRSAPGRSIRTAGSATPSMANRSGALSSAAPGEAKASRARRRRWAKGWECPRGAWQAPYDPQHSRTAADGNGPAAAVGHRYSCPVGRLPDAAEASDGAGQQRREEPDVASDPPADRAADGESDEHQESHDIRILSARHAPITFPSRRTGGGSRQASAGETPRPVSCRRSRMRRSVPGPRRSSG